MFLSGFLGWTWDAFDFFTVSLTVTDIAKDFGVSKADVSWVSFKARSPNSYNADRCRRELYDLSSDPPRCSD